MNFSDKLRESLSEILGPESEEVRILEESFGVVNNSSPTTMAEAKNHLLILDRSRVQLSTIYFMIGHTINKMRGQVQSDYDSQYVTLVKRGRPSKDAIEAEIRALNPMYSGTSSRIQELENIRDLVGMYIRCIDSSKSTTVEIFRNLGRID